MFGAGGGDVRQSVYYLIEYGPEFILSIAACLPIKRTAERVFEKRTKNSRFARAAVEIGLKLFAVFVFLLSYLKLATGSFNPFIYFQF